jgi:hypothetical protein
VDRVREGRFPRKAWGCVTLASGARAIFEARLTNRSTGEYKGYFQYDISKSERMIYWVDEGAKIVYVEYIGKHPDWTRHRKRPF